MSSDYLTKERFSNYNDRVFIKDGKVKLQEAYIKQESAIPVFVSHKHSDLEELKKFIVFLEKEYKIDAYIDSLDDQMPDKTSYETAYRIKQKILNCKKFILFATDDAVKSQWCNWELGIGDSIKSIKNVLLIPMKGDGEYKGNEYMDIYPFLVERRDGDRYSDKSFIKPGFYVKNRHEKNTLIELSIWLKN